MSLNFLATRFTCSWPWSTMVLLCDGRLVCGCADPYGRRVLGDLRTAPTVASVWAGDTAARLRQEINGGGSRFCGDCPLKLPLRSGEAPPQRSLAIAALPSRLYVECTAACNISCNQACCAPETGITRTRQAGMLDFDLFTRVIDETGPALVRIDFFNYGETFLHKRALEMVEYIKARFPHIYLYTSTNGLALSEEGARRLARSGIDEVTFSIDGATPDSYIQYRQRGDFGKAIRNLQAVADEKQARGLDVPFVNWRYILFRHNDGDPEMDLARRMAGELGVDRLSWEITDHPENMFSRRFVAGTPEHARIRHEIWDSNGLGNAIPGATPRAHIELGDGTWLHRVGRTPVRASARRPITVTTHVTNLSRRTFRAQASYGRRLVRVGAQLCGPDGALLNRDYERAWLPGHLEPGATVEVPMALVAPDPGQYRLKFDLVSEGVDWFENAGSPPTIVDFLVS